MNSILPIAQAKGSLDSLERIEGKTSAQKKKNDFFLTVTKTVHHISYVVWQDFGMIENLSLWKIKLV